MEAARRTCKMSLRMHRAAPHAKDPASDDHTAIYEAVVEQQHDSGPRDGAGQNRGRTTNVAVTFVRDCHALRHRSGGPFRAKKSLDNWFFSKYTTLDLSLFEEEI